ncbi:uncharacterized protein LOC127799489 isoform X2 [Diospyros lotus]|uniref:uncharacterized protein LOC127799489 isoform X2 n=1 Tax=Diospyros lotus TaxID=55363 RepID=UPI0022513C26|nr:uncharacterized protein LOC127799489 isoform X2 [Diospyros lotus]
MEELKTLERAQRTLQLMQSRGDNNPNDPDSDRFLANLILLLLHPCGELNLEKKCQLIYENLTEISAVFLEEALPCPSEEANSQDKSGFDSFQTKHEDMAMVGLTAMQDAKSTLEDFCRSYFMFHDMDVNKPQSIFRYLPILSFTESYIYQLDRLNEKILKLPTEEVTDLERQLHMEANQSCPIKFIELFKTDPFRPLCLLLEHHGNLNERIKEEFKHGKEYWALERKLCCGLTSNKKIVVEDVMRAIHLKSFDYRVLNLLLYQLRGEKVNELHMEFLSVSEFLVELSDDLIYGASTAPTMLAKCISEAEQKYDQAMKALDPKLSENYQKRCEEATKEGGKISGPSLGTWVIPPVIEDEDSYRSEFRNSKGLGSG